MSFNTKVHILALIGIVGMFVLDDDFAAKLDTFTFWETFALLMFTTVVSEVIVSTWRDLKKS